MLRTTAESNEKVNRDRHDVRRGDESALTAVEANLRDLACVVGEDDADRLFAPFALQHTARPVSTTQWARPITFNPGKWQTEAHLEDHGVTAEEVAAAADTHPPVSSSSEGAREACPPRTGKRARGGGGGGGGANAQLFHRGGVECDHAVVVIRRLLHEQPVRLLLLRPRRLHRRCCLSHLLSRLLCFLLRLVLHSCASPHRSC